MGKINIAHHEKKVKKLKITTAPKKPPKPKRPGPFFFSDKYSPKKFVQFFLLGVFSGLVPFLIGKKAVKLGLSRNDHGRAIGQTKMLIWNQKFKTKPRVTYVC